MWWLAGIELYDVRVFLYLTSSEDLCQILFLILVNPLENQTCFIFLPISWCGLCIMQIPDRMLIDRVREERLREESSEIVTKPENLHK